MQFWFHVIRRKGAILVKPGIISPIIWLSSSIENFKETAPPVQFYTAFGYQLYEALANPLIVLLPVAHWRGQELETATGSYNYE
jgi:hypothetical protein